MKKKKTCLTFGLVLALCVSLFATAFAEGESPEPDLCAEGHTWENGVCTVCKAVCEHAYGEDGLCTVCGMAKPDPCAEGHTWENGVCAVCETVCEHAYGDDGLCTVCGTAKPDPCAAGHTWADGVCSVCGATCAHESYGEDGLCVVCGMAKPDPIFKAAPPVLKATEAVTLTATGYSGTYDGKEHAASATASDADATVEYSVDGGTTWSTTVPTIRNAGTVTVNVRAVKDGETVATAEATLSVTPKAVTVTAPKLEKRYGDDWYQGDFGTTYWQMAKDGCTIDGLIEGDELKFEIEITRKMPYSTYSFSEGDILDSTRNGEYAKWATYSANGIYKVYEECGSELPDRYPYTLTPVAAADETNYTIKPVPGSLSIKQYGVYAVPWGRSKEYDGTPIEGPSSGLIDDWSLNEAPYRDFAPYSAAANGTWSTGSESYWFSPDDQENNYSNDYCGVHISRGNDFTTQPDGTLASTNQVTPGFMFNELYYFTILRADGKGGYKDVTGNYFFLQYQGIQYVYTNMFYTIEGHTNTVQYDGQSHSVEGYDVTDVHNSYNDKDYGLYRCLKDEIVASGINVGTYPMGLSDQDFIPRPDLSPFPAVRNYSFDVTDGWLEITPAPVVIEVGDYVKNYGDPDPVFKETVTGLFGDDTVTYTIAREKGEEPGKYPIVITAESTQGNYTVTVINGTLTILPPPSPEVTPTPTPAPSASPAVSPKTSDSQSFWRLGVLTLFALLGGGMAVAMPRKKGRHSK